MPNSIPGMELNENYKKNIPKIDPETEKKKFEKTKKELDKIKDFIVKKYKFTQAIGILPPQAIPKFIEEEEAPEESKDSVRAESSPAHRVPLPECFLTESHHLQ